MNKAQKAWLREPITYRQFLTEQTILDTEVEWYLADQAVDTILLNHPEIDGNQIKPRGKWKA